MRVHRSVACCTSQLFFVFVGYVLTSFGVPVALCQSEINHMHYILLSPLGLGMPHQEIVRLDVPMYKVIIV